MSELRVGVIGAGGMAGHHAELLSKNPRCKLVAVCDLVEEKAKKTAESLGCGYFTDYRKLLRRADIDAVLVGVPNPLHYKLALDSLRAGKHTTVEYPICQTVKQYDRLVHEAERRRLVLHDELTPLIEPQALGMRQLVGKIGKVMTMRSAYISSSSSATSWYVNAKQRGNFYSALTIHQIVYFNAVLGESPDWVYGALHTAESGGKPCHSGSYLCHYPSGVLGYNEWGMGFGQNPSTWEWIIEGLEGRLIYERPHGQAHQIRFQRMGKPDETTVLEPQANAHGKAIGNFVNQVLDHAAPYAAPETTREIIRICEAAFKSAQTGRRVSLA